MELVLEIPTPGQGRGPRRTFAPVRRHSRGAGHCEGGFWRPFNPKDVSRYLLAAERFERQGRQPGKRNGPIGAIGLEVLRELLRLVDYRSGRLDPALATIATRIKRSKDAVVRALASLRRHGFVDWLRRYEATGEKGRGPQVVQTSNAYRLALPEAAKNLLGLSAAEAPAPEDEAHRAEERKALWRQHLTAAGVEERNSAMFGAGPMASLFSRFERAVSERERESVKRSESSPIPNKGRCP